MERFTFRKVGNSLLRYDSESAYPHDSYWCVGRNDSSEHHDYGHYGDSRCHCGARYDTDCARCFLNQGHTCADHAAHVARYLCKQCGQVKGTWTPMFGDYVCADCADEAYNTAAKSLN